MDKPKRILIAGASGLVGSRLTEMLSEEGFQVTHLGRDKSRSQGIDKFVWDVKAQTIDAEALADIHAVINLAGTGVAEKRWSDERKKDILDSRIQSTALLYDQLKKSPGKINCYLSASAIGYYGPAGPEKIFTENDRHGNDFLSEVTSKWEKEADRISTLGIRVVKLRIGIVLSSKGGALAPIAKAANSLVGAPLGAGTQYMSWIHIDDLCRIFIHAINDPEMSGVYNAVAPEPVTNKTFIHTVAELLHKPVIFPKVPALALKLLFGEMSTVILDGARVNNDKILKTGFEFRFKTLRTALSNLLT